MVDATVDNTPVTVLLLSNETYTPASGSVQKVTAAVGGFTEMLVKKGGGSARLVDSRTSGGEPNVGTLEMVIDDTVTIEEPGVNDNDGVYISGFEVN